jgi:hypothetical protein
MSIASQILEKYKNKSESKSKEVIKALIDTNFSASKEEKGKAAELLKGLFYSNEPEAVEFIKELDQMLSDMKQDTQVDEEEGEVDFEKADIVSLWGFISNKINRKAPAKQAELYADLALKSFKIIKDVPSGDQKLRKLFKEFKSQM